MAGITKNDQVILLSAHEDLQDGRFNQVVNKSEHLLEKYPKMLEINDLYASALYNLKKFSEAYKVIQEFQNDFITNPQYQSDGLKIFLANDLFMAAREVLAHTSADKHQQRQAVILQNEDAYRQQHSNDLSKQTRRLAHLGSLPVYEQVHEITVSQKLPLKEYVLAAKTLLNDPFGWQVSKTQVLLQLMKVKFSENIQLYWLDGKSHTISIDELKPLDEYQSFVAVLKKVTEQFESEDPIKLDLVEKELFTQSNYIFPYFDEVITIPKFWAETVIAQSFGGTASADSPEEERMLAWIKLIHDQEIKIGLI
ncbi:hypothetical protein [Lentilactobacillus kefiri]|nr:hypothetical protein [Lentilactobacillus kefiri]MCJ2162334.1 hypothetical protein [Lentilactobacillus kefiri]MCP9368227.1 hypothetical protein [Lentilactobacillus kefiri]MDH5108994.1 hypothetical protein [Lentilactobacillus kefiri]MDM7493940.1 hypothetical protein [Lentilactobacillus kefiri]PAK60355.1 hypothetical protein B9K02_01860 [Lentilactobacillus kefiri]